MRDKHKIAVAEPIDRILIVNPTLWRDLRGKRVLVTGGTGFFGTWLLETIVRANAMFRLDVSVTVVTRSIDRFRSARPHLATSPIIQFVEDDVRHFRIEHSIDYLIHAATDSTPGSNGISEDEERNVIIAGAQHALDVAKESGAKAALYVSSGAVYGSQPEGVERMPEEYLEELVLPIARSSYGDAKFAAEQICQKFTNEGLPVAIARCYAFVGPYLPLDAHFAIGNFIRDANNGGPVTVGGDGTPLRSYQYMSDLSHWLWTILLRGRGGRAYNVGSEKEMSIAQIAEAIAGMVDPPLKTVIKQPAVAGRPASRYIPSTQRTQIELGLTQTVAFPEAVKLTKSWYDFED